MKRWKLGLLFLLVPVLATGSAPTSDIRRIRSCQDGFQATSVTDPLGVTRIFQSSFTGILKTIRRTNRGVYTADPGTNETLRDIFPTSMLKDIRGHILDIGCGGGEFVREINSGKIGSDAVAWGLDLFLDPDQKCDFHFILGTSDNMPIEEAMVDVAYSSMSFGTYLGSGKEGEKMLERSFEETHRVLRPGGRYRMGNVLPTLMDRIPYIPGFEITARVRWPKERNPLGAEAVEWTKR